MAVTEGLISYYKTTRARVRSKRPGKCDLYRAALTDRSGLTASNPPTVYPAPRYTLRSVGMPWAPALSGALESTRCIKHMERHRAPKPTRRGVRWFLFAMRHSGHAGSMRLRKMTSESTQSALALLLPTACQTLVHAAEGKRARKDSNQERLPRADVVCCRGPC